MPRFAVTKTVDRIDDAETGQKMRVLRDNARLSLRELGLRMSLSAAYLSDLELGRRAWTEERAREYVTALKKKGGK